MHYHTAQEWKGIFCFSRKAQSLFPVVIQLTKTFLMKKQEQLKFFIKSQGM